MKIHKHDISAIVGLIVAIVAMALPLQTEAKTLLAGTGVVPTVWRFVDLIKEHKPDLDSDDIWFISKALSVAIPVAAYLFLTASGQEVFSVEGLGEAFLVGAGIAVAAEKLNRKSKSDAKAKVAKSEQITNRILDKHIEGGDVQP